MAEKVKLDDLIESLRQERDELNLQLHLAKAEVKQEWEELEKKWENLEETVRLLRQRGEGLRRRSGGIATAAGRGPR